MLSIPVQGGITTVKRCDPLMWRPDDTRAWRRQHAGAINARLRRTPFYHHYASQVIDIITDTSITSIAEISEAIYISMSEAVGAESFISQLTQSDRGVRHRIKRYAESLGAEEADKEISLLNYLCRYGPDTIFIMAYPLL